MAVDSRGRKLPPLQKELTEYKKKQIKTRDDASVKKAEKTLIERRNPRKKGEDAMKYRNRLRRIQKDGETKKLEVKKPEVVKPEVVKPEVVKPEVEKKEVNKLEVKKSTSSFGKTFADARRSGKKTFMWNGKSYNTKRADDKPKPKPVKTQVEKDTKLKPMTGTESKSVKDLPPLTDKETKPGRNKALTEKLKKSIIDRAKNTTGINRPATAKEQMGRDQQKNARKSMGMKKGGMVKKCRMDGIALRGKTRAKERSK